MKWFPQLRQRSRVLITGSLLLALACSHAGCFIDESYQNYYGRVIVPRAQEFRWIDGGLPQTFDPAFAAAPPDTDVVRAIFEGLTDYDPRTLSPVPAVATRWESSNEGKVWMFYLREDARWSNGESVTAKDFVDSWQRTVSIGDLAPHTELLSNIVGARKVAAPNQPLAAHKKVPRPARSANENESGKSFGVQAIGSKVLRVDLERADPNFPALVAHPVFRPVKVEKVEPLKRMGPINLVSNGPFSLAKSEGDRILLERADNYWGKEDINLQHVEFVGAKDAEAALAAYRAGEVDAVTNSAFEPLALKLLAPYKDFRRETYGALTYYSFNTSKRPFDDVRVREALAIAIDRERISEDDLGGAVEPARKFLPEVMSGSRKPVVARSELLEQDSERARELFAEAGYPKGEGFPTIRLLINRNEQQRLVALSIAAMWRSALNVETEIVVRNWDEYESAIGAGDYDVVRRGIVMQTTDELSNIRTLFQQDADSQTSARPVPQTPGPANEAAHEPANAASRLAAARSIESEGEALTELRAIPLYFASSYALVKPYVSGFDSNVLDAPSLKQVRIQTKWSEPKTASLSRRP
jgi:oligopeptide transport system substrate-binding protein